MIALNVHEAKVRLSSLLAAVQEGETVVICKRNIPVAELRLLPVAPTSKRPIGLAVDDFPGFALDSRFFEPLPDDVVAGFYGQQS
ncbi:MAG: type II toxin-antitoxin system Phd/YefM family antitoxin [Desulfofustis sp. PB-SRB1]|jgi:prevent-host-death family protein|nr:type II toxin-antitoxin system Phd/YefM family antitoxin [Desulfofustis sp. PB-SRB1]MBM1003833.1 type II toxin-antitoxin system Phd/YefM family antitoxin [Desulfofustis sp. PB-SRB1]HBH27525.1 type II toxin-antitoxin system Phd/YefM family antitoxin [Desulfofustis sp.]HBH31311.1 type II toxin-antitoxin system Phd/YefM family antitoxin [Desulfofustis sp.]